MLLRGVALSYSETSRPTNIIKPKRKIVTGAEVITGDLKRIQKRNAAIIAKEKPKSGHNQGDENETKLYMMMIVMNRNENMSC